MLSARLNAFQSNFTSLFTEETSYIFFNNKTLHVLAYEKPIIRLFLTETY